MSCYMLMEVPPMAVMPKELRDGYPIVSINFVPKLKCAFIESFYPPKKALYTIHDITEFTYDDFMVSFESKKGTYKFIIMNMKNIKCINEMAKKLDEETKGATELRTFYLYPEVGSNDDAWIVSEYKFPNIISKDEFLNFLELINEGKNNEEPDENGEYTIITNNEYCWTTRRRINYSSCLNKTEEN